MDILARIRPNVLLLALIGAIIVMAVVFNGMPGEIKAAIVGTYIGGLIGMSKDILSLDKEEK